MSETAKDLRTIVLQSLSGRDAHAPVTDVIDGLEWGLAGERAGESPHTIFEIVLHMVYWQRFALAWIEGEKPPTPEKAADSWPGPSAPADQSAWADALGEFRSGLSRFEELARKADLDAVRRGKSVLEILQLVAAHNSYHCGQIVLLRRQLGAWPPPGGGATW